jgi:hypothetical protein
LHHYHNQKTLCPSQMELVWICNQKIPNPSFLPLWKNFGEIRR